MALQPKSIKIDGMTAQNPYLSILKKRDQKIYDPQEDGSFIGRDITFVHIGGAVDRQSWVAGDRFNLSHVVGLDGELTKDQVYPLLKTMKLPEFELDLTTAVDIMEG